MSHVCQQCVKTSIDVPACYWCQNCEKAMCECCKENHFQRHQFEKISSPLILINLSNCCGNHHDKEFEMFCRDHYSLCCVKCLIDDHRGCVNIASIVDASKEFKSHKVFDEYKTFLKTISKYFDILKKILITGENDVQKLTYNHQSEIESNFYLYVEISHQKIIKEICLEKVKHNKNTCLLELQKQISIVTKCKTDINTIETSLERIWEQLPEEKLFLMVHLSNTILKSTWKKAISDSESINLVFTRMKAGGKYEMVETHKRILPQNLLKLIRRLELADYGTQNGINSFPQFY